MANWAYIENQNIVETCDLLPKNWRNISNLDASESNTDFLKSIGWYPIEHNKIDYDPNLETLVTEKIQFDGKNVFEVYAIQRVDINQHYIEFMKELREKRNKLLAESDYRLTFDLVYVNGKKYFDAWLLYRQQLRDITQNFQNIDYYDIRAVVWPKLPYSSFDFEPLSL